MKLFQKGQKKNKIKGNTRNLDGNIKLFYFPSLFLIVGVDTVGIMKRNNFLFLQNISKGLCKLTFSIT